jgi:putative membrane protein
MEAVNAGVSLRDIVPVAKPERMDELIRVFIKSQHWPLNTWHSLHPNAWKRVFFIPAFFYAVLSGVLAYFVAPLWLLGFLLVPWQFLYARNWAKYSGFAYNDDLIAVRQGWLSKHWRFTEIGKLQNLILKQSPFDRRHDMASIYLDTAGASPMEPALKIDYLPIEQARELKLLLAEKTRSKALPF